MPPDWTLLRKTPVPPPIAEVSVRLKAAARFAGPVRVLKLLNADRTDDPAEVDAAELDELDDPPAERACSCCETAGVSPDSVL